MFLHLFLRSATISENVKYYENNNYHYLMFIR
jgi:hypothetical protein